MDLGFLYCGGGSVELGLDYIGRVLVADNLFRMRDLGLVDTSGFTVNELG